MVGEYPQNINVVCYTLNRSKNQRSLHKMNAEIKLGFIFCPVFSFPRFWRATKAFYLSFNLLFKILKLKIRSHLKAESHLKRVNLKGNIFSLISLIKYLLRKNLGG